MTYTTPTAANLKARFPAFAAVADGTVKYWIDEGDEQTASWPETGRAGAQGAHRQERQAQAVLARPRWVAVGLLSRCGG